MKSFLRIVALIIGLTALSACVPIWETGGGGDSGQTPPSAESKWAATLKTAKENVSMTVFLAPEDNIKSRLLIFASSGAAMGDCSLSAKGNHSCRIAPGAKPMVEKVATAVTTMLDRNANFVHLPTGNQGKIDGDNWNASRDRNGNINYKWTSSPDWAINFTRN